MTPTTKNDEYIAKLRQAAADLKMAANANEMRAKNRTTAGQNADEQMARIDELNRLIGEVELAIDALEQG